LVKVLNAGKFREPGGVFVEHGDHFAPLDLALLNEVDVRGPHVAGAVMPIELCPCQFSFTK